ncbi:MAG: DNA repair protein RecO [Lachnospiraceae bacterium]
MNQITVTGMVTASAPVGEYDRRVVLLTKERGKLSAFARGARKPNSVLVGVTSPFTFGTFTLYEGRTSYTLMSASVSNYFEELRQDVEGAYYGFYFLEFANYYAREANDETLLLKLLYQTLRALVNPHIPNRLIRCIYELKAVSVNGEGPQMSACVCCGNAEGEYRFSIKKGGLICEACKSKAPDKRKLLPSTLYTMQYIVLSPVEKLYTFVVKEDVLNELERVVTAYLEEYVGKTFKSLEILETIVK